MNDINDAMTLDPPGRIAIVGAGPLGLEAALYGRFLGYDVSVFESGDVGQSLRERGDLPLPMLPSLCLSPLAWAALAAQFGSMETESQGSLPMTVRQWIDDGLEKLASTDLLRDRVMTHHRVIGIELVDVTTESSEPDDKRDVSAEKFQADLQTTDFELASEIPPDFRITLTNGSENPTVSIDFEAVILAIGLGDPSSIAGFEYCKSADYFFRIGDSVEDSDRAFRLERSPEERLRTGWRQIVRIYAGLGGRAELDLYRPRRM